MINCHIQPRIKIKYYKFLKQCFIVWKASYHIELADAGKFKYVRY